MTPGHAQPSPRRSLSDTEEIAERFIRDGYVIIRGAIDGDRIRHLTHQSLALRDPQPLYRDGTGPYQRPIEEVDLLNPATWDRLSLYIQTRRELMIAD